MPFLFLYGRIGRTEEFLLKVLRLKSGMLKAKKRQEPSQARLGGRAYQLKPNLRSDRLVALGQMTCGWTGGSAFRANSGPTASLAKARFPPNRNVHGRNPQ